jgi:hypothetical protein
METPSPAALLYHQKREKKSTPNRGEKKYTEKSGVGQLSITRGQSVFYKKG